MQGQREDCDFSSLSPLEVMLLTAEQHISSTCSPLPQPSAEKMHPMLFFPQNITVESHKEQSITEGGGP